MGERAPEQADDLETLLASFDTQSPFSTKLRSLSGEWYTRQDIFDLEKKLVYDRSWRPFRFAKDFKTPGASEAVTIGDRQVIIIRGGDGVLRALPNSCTHQGAQLMVPANLSAGMEDARQCVTSCLICPNHQWKFRKSGKLVDTPNFREGEIDKEAESLKSLPIIEEWGQYIWVNPHPTGPSLRERLAPLTQSPEMQEFADMDYDGSDVFEMDCDAKIVSNNFHDGLTHDKSHPELASVADLDRYWTELFSHCNVQHCPLLQSDNPVVGDVRTGTEARYWGMFPNFMLNYSEGAIDINIVEPLGPGKCRIIFHYFFGKDWSREKCEKSKEASRKTQRQDIILCKRLKDGMPEFVGGRFCEREIGMWQMQKLHVEMMRKPLQPLRKPARR